MRLLATEAHLEALANLLPAAQYDVLAGLASGLSPQEVWDEVSQYLVTGEPQVDPEDITTAIARTPDQFVLVSGPDELAQILSHPFDAWRIFLHSTERDIAYRPAYAGPAMVTGGAGTGKPITALHRAVFLARRRPAAPDEPPILLTTFTRNLAEALERQLPLLTDDERIRDRIEVLNVDRLAYRIVAEAHGHQPAVIDAKVLHGFWEQAAASTAGAFSPSSLSGSGSRSSSPRTCASRVNT